LEEIGDNAIVKQRGKILGG